MQGVEKTKKIWLQSLRSEYETMHMINSESVDRYVTRLQTVANEMKQNGEQVDEIKIIEKLLRTLSSKFNNVVAAIE